MVFVILDTMPYDRWGEDGFTHATGYAVIDDRGLCPTYEGDHRALPADGDEVITESEFRTRFFGEEEDDED